MLGLPKSLQPIRGTIPPPSPLTHQRFDRDQAAIFYEMSLRSSRAKLEELAGEAAYVTDGTRRVEPEFEIDPSQRIPGCVTEL